MKQRTIGKTLAVAVILLFVGVGIQPAIATIQNNSTPIYNGNILYVGGSGSGNYTKIKDAIDNASNGDTVFVYDDSSPYNEIIGIRKSICLIGEDKNTTFIDGDGTWRVVIINSKNVIISGFTIQYGEIGIELSGSNHVIQDNIITNINNRKNLFNSWWTIGDVYGIKIEGSNNSIVGNIINRTISYFPYCFAIGVWVSGNDNIIKNNIISKTHGVLSIGLWISPGHYFSNHLSGNIITGNTITKTRGLFAVGLDLEWCKKTTVSKNNFIKNKRNAGFYNPLDYIKTNFWNENYWDKQKNIPYFIRGRRHLKMIDVSFMPGDEFFIWIPWIALDRNPAKEPYDI
ncbi:hypothetical protein AYK21_01035 [Thermoplasmatales archaeon SG8-52-2]|nr:MAG: hypothetical protein AYK21_01035 [Thermoplasmatales archaeon SG8-52-2]